MKARIVLFLMGLAVVFGLSTGAKADLITVSFTGKVTDIVDDDFLLTGLVSASSSFDVTITYDDDSSGGTDVGGGFFHYEFFLPLNSFSATVGSISFSTNSSGFNIDIGNDVPLVGDSFDAFESPVATGITLTSAFLQVRLIDSFGLVLPNNDLPSSPSFFDLINFTSVEFLVTGAKDEDEFTIKGEPLSASASAVIPEPGSLAMFGLGSMLLLGWARLLRLTKHGAPGL